MANDKKFVVKNGLTTQNISFVDDIQSASNTITVTMLSTDTLSFSGDSGQLFSITDSLSGTIFAVNDISGVPSIEVDDDGTIRFAETFGNVLIGTSTDDGTNKVQVDGTVSATGFTGDVTGNADTASALETARTISLGGVLSGSASFDGSSNITITAAHTSDPTITLTGAVTGSGTMTNLGSVSIATTATADPTLTLAGDATGSATFTNLGNATLTVTVVDDSHNHIISNVDGLQTALDAKASLSGATFTGDVSGTNLTLSGNLTVNGTTTTLNTTNIVVSDNLIELNNGVTSNANDSGIVIERGTTGDNAFIGWDESVDKFVVGTTTATGASTGNLTITTGTLLANIEGNVTGNASTATALQTARNIALTGAVTGNANFDGSGNISITTTATSDPTLTLAGDATGTATFTNLGNATLTVTVVDDSHTHDGRYYTETEADNRFVNVAGDTMSGDLNISYSNASDPYHLLLHNASNSSGVGIQFSDTSTQNSQWGAIEFWHSDTQSPGNAYGTTFKVTTSEITGPAFILDADGDYFVGSNKVFHDGYHPNADKWTTARTLSLSGDVTGSASIDGSGNVTLSTTIANGAVALGTDTTGAYVADVVGGNAIELSETANNAEGNVVTINHSDTSSQASVNNSNGTVIQDVTLDTYGHVTGLASVDLDGRYYTETEADNRFVNVTGDTMTGNLNFGDNNKAIFGAGSDLQIYHDGNNSFIKESNPTGSIYIDGTNVFLRSATGETFITCVADSYVQLLHDNNVKLTTSATGIDVTGTITSDGLTVDPSGDIRLGFSYSRVADADNGGGWAGGYNAYVDGATVKHDSTGTLSAIHYTSSGVDILTGESAAAGTAAKRRALLASNGDISFYEDTGTTPKFFWDASAEALGIGTSSPAASLDVIGTVKSTALAIDHSVDTTITFTRSGANTFRVEHDTSQFYFWNATTSQTPLLFTNSGNVIINETGIDADFRVESNTNTHALFVEGSSGNVGIGTTSPAYKLEVNGSFAATTKSFVIDHPTKPGMKLRHGSLEGPEDGVYVRGRLKDSNVIVLPDYWTGLVHEDSITVQLTPIGSKADLWVEDIVNNKVIVGGETINCFYFIQATRKDVESFEVEYVNE